MRCTRTVVLLFSAAVFISSCATSRSTINVTVPASQASKASVKGFVTLLDVMDLRRFEAAPRDPSVPSLQNTDELSDPTIKSRAIARKRGGYGKALGDILLPEGRTVTQVVHDAATRALTDKGYSVVTEGSQDFQKAIPVSIEIHQFWSWFSPGAFTVSIEFVGVIALKGDVLITGREGSIRGYSIVRSLAATDSQWQEALQTGVEDLIEKMKSQIKNPN